MRGRIPVWVKAAWTLWMAAWIPLYWRQYGPSNFLWLCDLGNLILTVALWRESRLLFSMQACGLLLVQLAWTLDFAVGLVSGSYPLRSADYMSDPAIPLLYRALSLFHVAVPVLLLFGVRRLGYDRRGWIAQAAMGAVVLPVCWLGWGPERNLNWVWGPFNRPQDVMPPLLYLGLCIAAYPAILYLPAHLALRLLFREPRRAAGEK